MKPRLFIGSSTEALDIAYAAQESLERYAEVTVWTQGMFELSSYTLEALIETLAASDFALFVFAPTDVTRMRGTQQNCVRDNVIFELGLFVGRLGRQRSFIILPRDEKLHLPTDLVGVTCATYANRNDGNLVAALGPATNQIRRAIEHHFSTTQGKADGFKEILNGLDSMVARIEDAAIKPDLILAFERSAAFVATALAQRLGVREMLVFNRSHMQISRDSAPTDASLRIGNGVAVDPEWFNSRVPIIAKYALFGGQNLEAGIRFLKDQGIEDIPPVFTLYISRIGKQRWPQASWVYDHRDVESALMLLPWLRGDYDFI